MYEHIRCNFLPSRYLLAWLVFLNVWIISLVIFVDLPFEYPVLEWILKVSLLLGIARYTYYILSRDYFFNHKNSIVACLYNKDSWRLVMVDGKTIEATLHGESVVWYELIILGFRYNHQPKTRFVTIFRDSCDQETQRKIRVQLRLNTKKQKRISVIQKLKYLILAVKREDKI